MVSHKPGEQGADCERRTCMLMAVYTFTLGLTVPLKIEETWCLQACVRTIHNWVAYKVKLLNNFLSRFILLVFVATLSVVSDVERRQTASSVRRRRVMTTKGEYSQFSFQYSLNFGASKIARLCGSVNINK